MNQTTVKQTRGSVIKSAKLARIGQLPPFTCSTIPGYTKRWYTVSAAFTCRDVNGYVYLKPRSSLLCRTVRQWLEHLTASVSDDQVASFLQFDGEQEGPGGDPAVLRRTVALGTRLIQRQLHANKTHMTSCCYSGHLGL